MSLPSGTKPIMGCNWLIKTKSTHVLSMFEKPDYVLLSLKIKGGCYVRRSSLGA